MRLRRQAQRLAQRVLGPAHPAMLRRWRRLQAAHRARRLSSLTREFVAWHGLQVSGGPVAGLRYPDASPTTLIPKLLGVYERELHAVVERAIGDQPELIVNVGAADGYYAVGLARRCPDATIYAFEADARARELLACVAAANGVAIGIEGAAGVEELRALPAGRALVVMDCEGCEATLLDPEVPLLRTATIIAELHDFAVSGDAVVARFASTHDITVIPTRAPPPEHSTSLALGLSEYRPGPMRWAVMFPR